MTRKRKPDYSSVRTICHGLIERGSDILVVKRHDKSAYGLSGICTFPATIAPNYLTPESVMINFSKRDFRLEIVLKNIIAYSERIDKFKVGILDMWYSCEASNNSRLVTPTGLKEAFFVPRDEVFQKITRERTLKSFPEKVFEYLGTTSSAVLR